MAADEDEELQPGVIVAVLKKHDVSYVIVGSFGAITQGVDLPMTDIDIVPSLDEENLKHLAKALDELGIESKRDATEDIRSELLADPSVIRDTTFWNFSTPHGGVDLVLQPSGFPEGFDALIANAKVVEIVDPEDASSTLEAIVADVRDIYE